MSIWVFTSEKNLKVTPPSVFPQYQNITRQRSSCWELNSPFTQSSRTEACSKHFYFRLLVFDQIIAFQACAEDLRTIFVCVPFALRGPGTAPYSGKYKGSRKPQPVLSRFSQIHVSLEVLNTQGTGQAYFSSPALLCREPTAQIDLWGAWPKVSKQGL